MESDPDADLAAEMARGNAAALESLYDRHEVATFRLLARLTGDRGLAEELLQETFTRVWTMARSFDPSRGRFKAWLVTVALNIARTEMAKKRYRVRHVEPEAMDGAAPREERPDAGLERSEIRERMGRALAALSPLLREVVLMRIDQDLTFAEIAAITKTPVGTLKARFHRAVEALRHRLDGGEGERP